MDGTIVDYHNRLPKSAVKAIQTARQNGHLVYTSTGRSKAEMPAYITNIGFDGMIGGNGSYVEHHGKVIIQQLISADESRRIVDWLHERGLDFTLNQTMVCLLLRILKKLHVLL